MEVQATGNSPLYLFEKFEVGVIHLDAARNVVAMNDFARKVLPVGEKQPFDKLVTCFTPSGPNPRSISCWTRRRVVPWSAPRP
jgi:LytTR family transcriptional regulator, CO-responsive transcriptional regulator RcoM